MNTPLIRDGKLTQSPLGEKHSLAKLDGDQKSRLREIIQKSHDGSLTAQDANVIIELRKAALS